MPYAIKRLSDGKYFDGYGENTPMEHPNSFVDDLKEVWFFQSPDSALKLLHEGQCAVEVLVSEGREIGRRE